MGHLTRKGTVYEVYRYVFRGIDCLGRNELCVILRICLLTTR